MPWAPLLLCLAACGQAAAFSPGLTSGPPAFRQAAAGAFAARSPVLPAHARRSTPAPRSVRMLEAGEAAMAAFLLFNAAYVGQLLTKPRQQADGDPYTLLQVPVFDVRDLHLMLTVPHTKLATSTILN
jgi:hypothetical protein